MRSLITSTLVALAALVTFPPSSAAAEPGWTWPVRGEVISPYRNGDDPYASGQHRGIDIAAPVGADVGAATAGTVTFSGRAGSSGLTVNVRTADGRFDVSYLHLSSTAVERGRRISAGERVGAVGTSGTRSTDEPHLHLGVRAADSRHGYRDPLELLPPAGKPGPDPDPPAAPVDVPVVPLTPVPLPLPAAASGELPRPAPAAVELPGSAPAPLELPGSAAAAIGLAGLVPAPAAGTVGEPAPRLPLAPAPAVVGSARGRSPKPAHGRLQVPAPGRSHAITAARSAGSARGGAPASAPGRSPAPGSRRSPAPSAQPDRPENPARKPGIDVGWLAACLGLVTVALALGRPAGPGAALRNARSTVSALARPLTGRG